MSEINPKIEASWLAAMHREFDKDYFAHLKNFVQEQKKAHQVYPPPHKIFAAFDRTPFQRVKVVIIGQDPYHGPGQANGLSFSVNRNMKVPPSLKNIYRELEADLGLEIPAHGDLSAWCQQGVLLLNAVLTVNHKSPGSHSKQGWEKFTDAVIKTLSDQRQHLVFILWGKFAQGKRELIDAENHLLIESPHPSPFSAHSGFFGSRPFSKANNYLQKHGITTVQWQIN